MAEGYVAVNSETWWHKHVDPIIGLLIMAAVFLAVSMAVVKFAKFLWYL